jgi:hypothetical protein
VRKAQLFALCSYLLTTSTLFGASSTTTATGSTGANATSLLGQLSTAFSGGNVVHQVQLTGNASWHAGSLNDTGSATLSAATTGASQLQLSLSSGTRTETASGEGTSLICTWAGEDGVTHSIDPGNCWRPFVWFLPPLSLQPSLLPSYLGAVDLGSGKVGFGSTTYRHFQGELVFPNLTGTLTSDIMQRSTADIGLNSTSLLPAVLSYNIRPDNGAPIPIAVEIHYSNYQPINGVQIPFTIQRYINGTLQLEISVTSAQVN